MANKDDLPGFTAKRKALFGARASPQKLRRTGEVFMAADRYDDALEFAARCDAQEPAREIARTAMAAGDTPLFMRAKRVLREEVSGEEWTELAANAEKAGRYSMAYVAHRKAGHEEEAARLRRLVPGMQAAEADEAPDEGEATD